MSTGMFAYDVPATNITRGDSENMYICTAEIIAKPGEILKKGTPVFVKAPQGEYNLEITMSDKGAKGSSNGSILHGNYVMQELQQSEELKIFTLSQGDHNLSLYPLKETDNTITANSCWAEWPLLSDQAEAQVITLIFNDETTVKKDIEAVPSGNAIYNLAGQSLDTPQKGVNIIGNKKVIIN